MAKEVGEQVGVNIEIHGDDKVRYRQKLAEGTPGIWISSKKALKILLDAYSQKYRTAPNIKLPLFDHI